MPSIQTQPPRQIKAPVPIGSRAAQKKARVRFVVHDRAYSTAQLLTMLSEKPKPTSQLLSGGLKVEASPILLDLIRLTSLGQYVGNDGEVETQGLTGLEEALIVIAVIGFFSGLGVGYLKGHEDGMEAAASEESEGSEGGDDSGEGEEGGDDAGDGEGP